MAYVQEPSKDIVDVRELFTTRICLGVTAASHVDMVLGDGARERGALADEIPGDEAHAGIGFVIDPGSRLPVRFRAAYVSDDEIDELVTRCATWARPGDVIDLAQRRDEPPTTGRRGRRRGHRRAGGGAGVMRTLDPTRTPEYRAAMTVIVGACALAALGSVIPAVEYAANVGMAGLAILAAAGDRAAAAGAVRARTPRGRRRRPHRRRLARRPPPHARPTAQHGDPRGCRDVGRHRLGRRDLAQNHGRSSPSASVPPGCGARPAGSPSASSPPCWLSCGPSASSPANGPTRPARPGGGPHDRRRGRRRRDAGQLDLFGDPPPRSAAPGSGRPSRIESNDVDLMVTVAANAVRCGYLLVGAAERVYARTDADDQVARVPRYEEDAVHQLLRRRWLTLGAAHRVTCGAAHLSAPPCSSRRPPADRIARWDRLQRPPSWPDQHHHPDPGDGPTRRPEHRGRGRARSTTTGGPDDHHPDDRSIDSPTSYDLT